MMTCKMKLTSCCCPLQTTAKIIGSVDMLVNITIGVLHSSKIVVNGPFDVTIAIAVFAFILAIFSILLIYGAQYRRRHIVMSWLIVQLLERCFIAVFIAVGLVRHSLGVIPIVFILFVIILAFYLWWAVCCFYFELKSEERADLNRSESLSRQPVGYDENADVF
ncbi:uncharacterized protein LOC130692425 [Daphnia carinata]|uniref:uncharacterized protein LOC130692425 n=1 Tax=Daphnia carinata TaxID=120202 RepID=UPI0028691631|nr:uncharacterized protein LOC130692425 [Daphnia carinata]